MYQKTFIRIDESDRDVQGILWHSNLKDQLIKEFRCSRVVFGASPSPYILRAVIERHLGQYKEKYTDTINTLKKDSYVDDIQGGGDLIESLRRFKVEATQIMAEAGFALHKWHSNVGALELDDVHEELKEISVKANDSTKILRIGWNKSTNILDLDFTPCNKEYDTLTKRKVILTINSLYDVLGWVVPITITGKVIFSDVCKKKLTWDEPVPPVIEKRWKDWKYMLEKSKNTAVPRTVQIHAGSYFKLHGFSDARNLDLCAAMYVVEYINTKPVSQHLLAAKSRIAPKGQSISKV